MKEGMLIRNEDGFFTLDEVTFEGKVEKDEFGEYYFTNGFLVFYLFEGLPVKIK